MPVWIGENRALDLRHLRADCERCFGLCCVAPAFLESVDFAITKHAGEPCPHLQRDSRCDIHQRLRQRGFRGCAVYDCFGAGQHVAQVTFAGQDWRQSPRTASRMFEVFGVMRQLHELVWYLLEATALPAARPLHGDLMIALEATQDLTERSAEGLLDLDLRAHARAIDALLARASEAARGQLGLSVREREPADLAGAVLRGADLCGANLRESSLIAADLRGADLRLADVRGADFRDADLRGARLGGSLFLTQPQLESARGDASTTVPPRLARPGRWPDQRRGQGSPISVL